MAGTRHEHRRRSPQHRSSSGERRHKSSQDRDRRPSPSSWSRDDRSERRPSPSVRNPQKRSAPKKPLFSFGRGRKPTRDHHKGSTFSVRTSSRSTSRGTSRSRSRDEHQDRVPSFLITPGKPSWDLKGRSPRLSRGPSIGFATPAETPTASPRIDVHLYLSLTSLIALGSVAAAAPPSLRTGAETAILAIQGLCFVISLLTAVGLRYDPTRESLTRPLFRPGTPMSHVSNETLINSLQFLLWCTSTGIGFSASRVVNDTPSSIWNTNLYYSMFAGMGLSSFLLADSYTAESSRVYWSEGHNFKPCALQRSWALVLIGQIALVAFSLQAMTACVTGDCGGYAVGVSLGMIGALMAVVHFIVRILHTVKRSHVGVKQVSLVETSMASLEFVLASANAAVLTSSMDEYASINVYFICWMNFFLDLNLCLRYFDAHLSPGAMMSDSEYKIWAMKNEPQKPPVSDNLVKRRSTGSTKSSKSSLADRIQDALQAEAHLESMVASRESSEPLLYLDHKTNASPLSVDEEFGQRFQALPPPPEARRSSKRAERGDPSICLPNTGVDPEPSVSTASHQKSLRAIMPPPARNRRPSMMEPEESSSSPSVPLSVPPARNRRPSMMEPEESSSSPSVQPPKNRRPSQPPPKQSKFQRVVTMAPAPPPFGRKNGQESKVRMSREHTILMFPQASENGSESSESAFSEYERGPAKTSRRASVARSTMAESVSTASQHDARAQTPKWEAVESMSASAKQQPEAVPTKKSSDRKTGVSKTAKMSSMLSLFEEDFTEDVMVAMAEVEISGSSHESSPNTVEPPSTLEPSFTPQLRSQSPGIRASPSIKSNRTNKSKGSTSLSRTQSRQSSMPRSGPSPAMSRTSSRAKSSTTNGSRGPPTLSEDGSKSPRTKESSAPFTISDNEEEMNDNIGNLEQCPSVQGRPLRDISTEDASIISDPTMDGFDQSQRFDQSSQLDQSTRGMFMRHNTTGTHEGDESHTGTVDQMVMMALKQAYETRRQSLRQVEDMSRGSSSLRQTDLPRRATSSGSSSLRQTDLPRRATTGSEVDSGRPSRHSFNRASSKTGSSGKSIRSFYSNNDSAGDDSQHFGRTDGSGKSIRSFYSKNDSAGDDSQNFAC